jgi:CBS domain-containing protein
MSLKVATAVDVRVCDVMSSPVLTLSAGSTLAEANAALASARVGGMAVVSETGRLVGMISAQDCLDPRHADPNAPIGDAMTRVLFAVRPGDPLTLAVQLKVDQHIHRVLVVGETGALIGIVTSMDVLRAMAASPAQRSHISFVRLNDEAHAAPPHAAST